MNTPLGNIPTAQLTPENIALVILTSCSTFLASANTALANEDRTDVITSIKSCQEQNTQIEDENNLPQSTPLDTEWWQSTMPTLEWCTAEDCYGIVEKSLS